MFRLLLAAAASAALTVLAACTSAQPGPDQTAPPSVITATNPASEFPTITPAASVPPLVHVSDPGKVTVTGILAGKHCHATGPAGMTQPDPACTPGAIDPAITAAKLCAPAYTTGYYRPPASGRNGTTAFKYGTAYPAYGYPDSQKSELDHLVNLDLGGANADANLWPEIPAPGKPAAPNPKDRVEITLHNWVCGCPLRSASQKNCHPPADAQGRLDSAQQQIAADWLTALDVLGVPAPTPKASP